MIKKIIILEVLVFVLILLTNSFIDKNSKMNISFNQIEALAQGETKNCPPQKCNDGGCGSSSCSLGQSYPGGLGSTHSVTAQSGYFVVSKINGVIFLLFLILTHVVLAIDYGIFDFKFGIWRNYIDGYCYNYYSRRHNLYN